MADVDDGVCNLCSNLVLADLLCFPTCIIILFVVVVE